MPHKNRERSCFCLITINAVFKDTYSKLLSRDINFTSHLICCGISLLFSDCMFPCTSSEGEIWYYAMCCISHWFNPIADLSHAASSQWWTGKRGNTESAVWEFVGNKALLQQEGKYLRLHLTLTLGVFACVLTILSAEASLPLKRSAGF